MANHFLLLHGAVCIGCLCTQSLPVRSPAVAATVDLKRLAFERARFQRRDPAGKFSYEVVTSASFYYPLGKGLTRYFIGWSRTKNCDVLVKQAWIRSRVINYWELPLERNKADSLETGTLNSDLWRMKMRPSRVPTKLQLRELTSSVPLASYFYVGPTNTLYYELETEGEAEPIREGVDLSSKVKRAYPIPSAEKTLLSRQTGSSVEDTYRARQTAGHT